MHVHLLFILQARIGNNTRLNRDKKKWALVANKKITWALAFKLKGGATIARGKNEASKQRMDSK